MPSVRESILKATDGLGSMLHWDCERAWAKGLLFGQKMAVLRAFFRPTFNAHWGLIGMPLPNLIAPTKGYF